MPKRSFTSKTPANSSKKKFKPSSSSSNSSNSSNSSSSSSSSGAASSSAPSTWVSKTKQPQSKSLGAWFPAATTRKVPQLTLNSKTDQTCTILLFYHYVRPQQMTMRRTEELRVFLDRLTHTLQIGGRIRYAQEGLNCTVSGTSENIRTFASKLSGSKPSGFGPEFKDTDFKFIDDLPHDRCFKDLKLIPVKELVFYGVRENAAPLAMGGVHLRPQEYHEKMQEKETVIVDVRNSYEAAIGRFVGQEQEGGAEYIDPKMRKSTDFKGWLDKPETQEKLKGKQVLLYCTGGVRCERASALINHQIGKEIKGVYQLHGGVEKYMQEFPDGGYWKGLNYVFDKREGVGTNSAAGVGGVVGAKKKKKKKKKKKNNKKNKNNDDDEDSKILGRCCICNEQWERYIGKKKCYTCGVPVLMCDSCMSLKIEKIKGRELECRCKLCVEENITVPASMTVFTDNGEGSRPMDSSNSSGGKASASVMKWGGGDQWGSKKKKKRIEEASKNVDRSKNGVNKPCRFGKNCTRKDCWFTHSGDGGEISTARDNTSTSHGSSHSSSHSSGHSSSHSQLQKASRDFVRQQKASAKKGTGGTAQRKTFDD